MSVYNGFTTEYIEILVLKTKLRNKELKQKIKIKSKNWSDIRLNKENIGRKNEKH